jgi:hypothetical protein
MTMRSSISVNIDWIFCKCSRGTKIEKMEKKIYYFVVELFFHLPEFSFKKLGRRHDIQHNDTQHDGLNCNTQQK